MQVTKGGFFDNFATLYCKNRYAFWLVFVLTIFLIFLITSLYANYRCWQWKTNPLAAAILERIRHKKPVPRICDLKLKNT